MITGLSYALVAITVAILLWFAGRQRHDRRDGADLFRYPSMLLTVIGMLTPAYGLMGAFIYSRYPQGPSKMSLLRLAAVFGLFIVGNSLVYLYLRSFSVEITDTLLTVRSFIGIRSVRFADVRTVCCIAGRRGGAELRLLGSGDRQLFKIGSTIQDFDELVTLIRNNSQMRGVRLRECDRSGRWSESVII
jgi:hypothetical protein